MICGNDKWIEAGNFNVLFVDFHRCRVRIGRSIFASVVCLTNLYIADTYDNWYSTFENFFGFSEGGKTEKRIIRIMEKSVKKEAVVVEEPFVEKRGAEEIAEPVAKKSKKEKKKKKLAEEKVEQKTEDKQFMNSLMKAGPSW